MCDSAGKLPTEQGSEHISLALIVCGLLVFRSYTFRTVNRYHGQMYKKVKSTRCSD